MSNCYTAITTLVYEKVTISHNNFKFTIAPHKNMLQQSDTIIICIPI